MTKTSINSLELNSDDQLYLILICTFIYTYLYISFNVSNFIIHIYKNPIFKVSFLLILYFYGNENVLLTFFLAINYVGLGLKIQNQELLK
jgi:hypothetical protein